MQQKFITVDYPKVIGEKTERAIMHLQVGSVGNHTPEQIKKIVEHAFAEGKDFDATKRQLAVFGLTEIQLSDTVQISDTVKIGSENTSVAA
jgi:hypothetical protein